MNKNIPFCHKRRTEWIIWIFWNSISPDARSANERSCTLPIRAHHTKRRECSRKKKNIKLVREMDMDNWWYFGMLMNVPVRVSRGHVNQCSVSSWDRRKSKYAELSSGVFPHIPLSRRAEYSDTTWTPPMLSLDLWGWNIRRGSESMAHQQMLY